MKKAKSGKKDQGKPHTPYGMKSPMKKDGLMDAAHHKANAKHGLPQDVFGHGDAGYEGGSGDDANMECCD